MIKHGFCKVEALVLCAAIGLSILSVKPVQADLINPGFETGTLPGTIPGWTTIGRAVTRTSSLGVGPVEGTKQVELSSNPASVSQASLESFFGLGAGVLDSLALPTSDPDGATQGSGILQTFSGNAGDTISFAWNFMTDEATPSSAFNDGGFYVFDNVLTKLVDTNYPSFSPAGGFTGYAEQTGYQTLNIILPTTGTHTIGFGVFDVGNTQTGSSLFIDATAAPVAATPEPGTWAMMGIGLCGVVLMGRKKKLNGKALTVA